MMVRIVPLAAVLLILAAHANARILPSRSKQVKVYSYVLPAGAEEIRDDINHSFACGNRTDGFYVDIDNDCQIFHRCQDHARFSFICAERTVFSQMYQTCVHDGQLGYPCEESAQYYPDGEDYEPSAPGSEPAEEAPQVEEMHRKQQVAPVQELEAPSVPSQEVEAIEPSEETVQDNAQQPSEQAEFVQVMNDDPEQHQEQEEHHQVNADLFDPIEEEGDMPSENSAQEIMDESEPSSMTVSSEATSANPSSQEEESNEVEVMDDTKLQHQEYQEHEQSASSEPSSVVESFDTTSQNEVTAEEQPESIEMDTQGTPSEPAVSATPVMDNETQYEADSLLNAVQMVEELEPIVHDLAVETDELKPLVAEIVQDPTPPLFVPANQQDNEVLPESQTNTADMEVPQMTSDASSTVNDSEQSSATVESEQQVNELSPQTELSSAASSDDSSETQDTISVEADETVQPASEPETVDAKLVEDDGANTPTKEQEQPLTSPAIVEEMAPPRPNDSAELPELIVSTEFHLDAVTQGPPIRRRKTFLFRADAIRSRQ